MGAARIPQKILHVLGGLAALLCLAASSVATAQQGASVQTCYATVDQDAPVSRQLAGWRNSNCTAELQEFHGSRVIKQFELPSGERPRFATSRATKFSHLTVAVVAEDGLSTASFDFENIRATYFDRQFIVPLPEYEGDPVAVLIAIDGVTQRGTIDYLELHREPPGSSEADRRMLLLIALITGMMLMPILFDLIFYRILREKFILWHAVLVFSLALQLVCTSGLYVAIAEVRLPMIRVVTIGSFNLMVVAALMFSLYFIEPDKLSRRARPLVLCGTAAFTFVSSVHLMGIEALGHWPALAYYTSGGLLGPLAIWVFVDALRRGSHAARFLAVGLMPLLIVALTRVVTFLIPGIPTMDANALLIAATLIEVTATALGVASQFLRLKLDRDRAHAEKDLLEDLATSDPLTGLSNRRVVETRFAELRKQGFDTFVLLDLDRFKLVNDRHGHQVGDAVLVACARAIDKREDRDTIAVRLGGEEFVVLLRGPNARQRAAAMREAIPNRVAHDVPDLDQPVTASMGLIELPRAHITSMTFEDLYARADTLLYEAKEAGRNRMVYERLMQFGPGMPEPAGRVATAA